MPQAKKDHYKNSSSMYSIKQQLMMKEDVWGEKEIQKHSIEMKKIFQEELKVANDQPN